MSTSLNPQSLQKLKEILIKAGKRGLPKTLFLQKLDQLNLPNEDIPRILESISCHWDIKAQKYFSGQQVEIVNVVEILVLTKDGRSISAESNSLGKMTVTITSVH